MTVESEESGPELWHYVHLAAQQIYGSLDARCIEDRVTRFLLENEGDLEVSDARAVIRRIYADDEIPRAGDPISRKLVSLATEMCVSNQVNLGRRHQHSDDALFLWILELCISDRKFFAAHFSLAGLAEYACRPSRRELLLLLYLLTHDIIQAFSWDWVPEAVLAHVCVSVSFGVPSCARHALLAKARPDYPLSQHQGTWDFMAEEGFFGWLEAPEGIVRGAPEEATIEAIRGEMAEMTRWMRATFFDAER